WRPPTSSCAWAPGRCSWTWAWTRATSIWSRWPRPSRRAPAPSCRCILPACRWTWSGCMHSRVSTGCASSRTPRMPSAPPGAGGAAAVGLGQLRRLEEFNTRRRALAARYFELWGADAPLRLPERGDAGHSWHVFTPLLPLARLRISRREFIESMEKRGIGVGVHYAAIHLFSAYRALGYREGQFPNAERIGRETVTLPLFPAMELHEVERVVRAV